MKDQVREIQRKRLSVQMTKYDLTELISELGEKIADRKIRGNYVSEVSVAVLVFGKHKSLLLNSLPFDLKQSLLKK